MLKRLYGFKADSVVGLIPNSGVQFLDFGMKPESIKDLKRAFWDEINERDRDAEGRPAVDLHPLDRDGEGTYFFRRLDGSIGEPEEDAVYTVRAEQALERLAGQWLPLPVLREKESGRPGHQDYDAGPTNWARLYVAPLYTPDGEGHRWRVVIALDTLVVPRPADDRYVAPEPRDVQDDMRFVFLAEHGAIRFFLTTDWVRGWLREAYLEAETRRKRARTPLTVEDLSNPGEYWAYYIVLLEAVARATSVPILRFLDRDMGGGSQPVEVDLAMDVGNSRTCGIFIEDNKEAQRLDMSQAYRLELRDLSNPHHVYAEPFESHIEFHPASFGRTEFSRKARRPKRDAFWWPSPVRVGPEAAWLAGQNDGTLGQSGLSSPKRYLWDSAARPRPWVNNRGPEANSERVQPIKGPIPARLTEKGDLVKPGVAGSVVGMEPKYSRASVYTLMLAEILIHAVTQINSPSVRSRRARSDDPRRLRRIILTLPSATPVAEQKALMRRARDAVRLVWQVMEWDQNDPIYKQPEIIIDWDEATATHLVYLYNEITQKFQRSPREFFALMRREGAPDDPPRLRVASMDMGGGTTDLMVIEHRVEGDRTIQPVQIFREGFRLAGDDIVKQVIESAVLPRLAEALRRAGVKYPGNFLVDHFGGDREGMSQQDRSLRGLFVNQVLRPAALALLGAYEQTDFRRPEASVEIPFMAALPAELPPKQAVLDYVIRSARQWGGAEFDLDQVVLRMDAAEMAGIIQGVVQQVLLDLCDVVRAYDCDILLLSGRPSRLPVINELIRAYVPVPANRIVPMDGYEVGNWYPFHSSSFRIEDPKTTAAVGAMLCYVCEGNVEGMIVRVHELKMRSTARYIGFMEKTDQILDKNLAFRDIDLDAERQEIGDPVNFEPPVFLGYRQLPLERWKTTPLYYVTFKRREAVRDLRMPLTVVLERGLGDEDESEEKLEEFEIREAYDANGTRCEDALRRPQFQTLRVEQDQEAGYWLDSGVLTIDPSL